jgi:hypothetical protein
MMKMKTKQSARATFFQVRYAPRNEYDRNIGVGIMEQNRDNLNIDGKIFSHAFETPCQNGGVDRHGSVSCYVPNKEAAHFLAFEIETKVGCITTVEVAA